MTATNGTPVQISEEGHGLRRAVGVWGSYTWGGSGTKKQDKVDCEEQPILKKRSLQWSPSPYTAFTVRASLWSAMDMLPMANSCIAAARADGKVARTRLPMPVPKHVARRFCTPTKNVAACVASRVRLVSRARLSRVGSKKSSSASPLMDYPAHPGPRGFRFPHPRTGRTVVVCAQKSQRLLDLDCPVPSDTASGRLCRG